MDALERELQDARERNKARLKVRPPKPEPRWRTQLSPAQIERQEQRVNKRLARAPLVVHISPAPYRTATGSQKRLKPYGLTREQWLVMVEQHGSRCAICGKEEQHASALAIDHCHRTQRVRGLLCRSCNTGIGQFRDDPELVAKALAYLRKFA